MKKKKLNVQFGLDAACLEMLTKCICMCMNVNTVGQLCFDIVSIWFGCNLFGTVNETHLHVHKCKCSQMVMF